MTDQDINELEKELREAIFNGEITEEQAIEYYDKEIS